MLTERLSERKFMINFLTNVKVGNFFPFYLVDRKFLTTFASSNKTTNNYGQEFYENNERKSHEGNH